MGDHPLILSEAEHGTMLSRMLVCGPCGDVVGPARHPRRAAVTIVQAGTCPAHQLESRFDWEGFDFNRLIECKEHVGLLTGRRGRYAVPSGRHPFHAGWVLKPEQVDDPIGPHIFTDSFNSASRAMDFLGEWTRVAVRLNLTAGGWSSDAEVPALDYCGAVHVQVDPLARFREMCRYLGERGRAAGS